MSEDSQLVHDESQANAEGGSAASSVGISKKKKKKRRKKKKYKRTSNPLFFTIPEEALVPYVKNLQLRLSEGKLRGLLPYLGNYCTEEELQWGIRRYRLGCVHKDCVLFPFFDIEGQLRIMKVVRYDDMGKRKRNGISTSHSYLKEDGIIPAQWKERPCLFGEHLLTMHPEQTVIIVEGEKTALVCAILMPSYIWLATAGCGHFREVGLQKSHLNTRTTYILPDKGQYDNWVKEARKYQVKGRVLDFIEKMDVERNTDIADLLLSDKHDDCLKEFAEHVSAIEEMERKDEA